MKTKDSKVVAELLNLLHMEDLIELCEKTKTKLVIEDGRVTDFY